MTEQPTAHKPACTHTWGRMTQALSPVTARWWQTAVIYQIYPRSFADGNGDGTGDLAGITSRLPALAALGIDAVWLSPIYKSPQEDGGYDVADYQDIDPLFGTLADFDVMMAKAKELQLRVIMDMVPNHCSSQHPLFQSAVRAGPGSAERAMFHFSEGKGLEGELPPNNWGSVFGGPAWTRIVEPGTKKLGQWYLHIFAACQPDFNWENPAVADMFDDILRFWLIRGTDGFRIDVAHGMVKKKGLPDIKVHDTTMSGAQQEEEHPFWGLDEVHVINRRWRRVIDEFDDRAMCAEAWLSPLSKLAKWVRPDEYHQAFNFNFLMTGWEKDALIEVVTKTLYDFGVVSAPSTWVLSNHDVIRHVSRFGLEQQPRQGDGIGPDDEQPNEEKGLRIGRAATAFMLGLPGSAYIYQGEELGLPEHTTLERQFRQDPTFFRTEGKRVGRDGCRVPLPWEAGRGTANGFSTTGKAWLAQPLSYERYARDRQEGVQGSTLELYKLLLQHRKKYGLAVGSFTWAPQYAAPDTLAYLNDQVLVLSNFGPEPAPLPAGTVLMRTQAHKQPIDVLEQNETVWILLENV